MAYSIHITRRKKWFDKSLDIVQEEWQKLLKEDLSLLQAEKIEGKTQDGDQFEYRIKGSQPVKWIDTTSKKVYWFVYDGGKISVSDPTDAVIEKAKELAKKLNAKVQGDELEFYE